MDGDGFMVCGDVRLSDTGGTGWFSLMGSCKECMCVGWARILLVCGGERRRLGQCICQFARFGNLAS